MTDETRARFLAAIAAQLPADRIAEVHLFPAIRQGGMESGVAVIAVEPLRAVEDREVEAPAPVVGQQIEQPVTESAADAETIHVGDVEALDADDHEPFDTDEADVLEADVLEADELEPAAPPTPAPRRYTVFSARYRHTLKGPDRGKWETSVIEEADAPLLTVDAVVRGVQRRSGDVDEIVRLSGDEVRAALNGTTNGRNGVSSLGAGIKKGGTGADAAD